MATTDLMPTTATGIGSETSKPLAVVVVGGLITGIIFTLFGFPPVFEWFYCAEHTHCSDDSVAGRANQLARA